MAQSLYDFCVERDELDLLAQWNKEKNGTLTPRDVAKSSHQKVWWRCKHDHEWQTTVFSRGNNRNGCPACAGRIALPGENDLASQNPHVAAQWHPTKNGTLKPDQVTQFSNQKVWWLCDKGHAYFTTIAYRTKYSSGCPYCSNKKVLAGYNDFATTNPELAAQWHPTKNGELTPQSVFRGGRRKVWWQCEKGHEWEAALFARSCSGSGCPVCAGRREHK